MSAPRYEENYTTLLHPWEDLAENAPIPVSLQLMGDKITLAFPDAESEVVVECDNGAPRLLVYHPESDAPLSLRWTPTGFLLENADQREDGLVVTLN